MSEVVEVRTKQEAAGIKLFGKTIVLQVKQEPHNTTAAAAKISGGTDEERSSSLLDKRPDKIIACPRCRSMDTKFCYFNNYNVNQPRHFCKSCHRYWTAGGALRNVPVGAGRRKSKPGPDARLLDATFIYQHANLDHLYWAHHQQLAAASAAGDEFHPAKRRRDESAGQTILSISRSDQSTC